MIIYHMIHGILLVGTGSKGSRKVISLLAQRCEMLNVGIRLSKNLEIEPSLLCEDFFF